MQQTNAIATLPDHNESRHQLGTIFSVGTSGVERVIYRFLPHHGDGHSPQAGLFALNGELYGTTVWGGGVHCGKYVNWGCGTVFAIKPSGHARWLYDFKGGEVDGDLPVAGLIAIKGELYGTTQAGGNSNCGSVFKISTLGNESILHSFNGQDGASPYASLTVLQHTLYGTTYNGGGWGNVFAMNTSGEELWQYDFKGYPGDGEHPWSSLVALNGTLYGTTVYGGASDTGTVFAISSSGQERVLYSFKDFKSGDGFGPYGGLVTVNGELYGTTENGGSSNRGTVFKVTTSGAERVLYRFKGDRDGAFPAAGLIALNGELYGTTYSGGDMTVCSAGCGTIFKVSTSGDEHVLYRFKGASDGVNPEAPLAAVSGVLYGTTYSGGAP